MNNDRLNFRRAIFYKGKFDSFQYVNVGIVACFYPGPNNEFTHGPWEQCTGLRDKNGNLIYENDICRVKAASGGYETVLVVWDGAAWRFQCGPWVKLMCFWNPDEIEIIGNIHTQKDGE